MINRAIDVLFTDSLAFAVNLTLGLITGNKLCNYSWEETTIRGNNLTEEISDLFSAEASDFLTAEINNCSVVEIKDSFRAEISDRLRFE